MVVRLIDKHVNQRSHISTKMKLRFILILPEVDTLAINRQYRTAYNMYHAVHNMQDTILHTYIFIVMEVIRHAELIVEWFLWTIEHTNRSLDNSNATFCHHGGTADSKGTALRR